MKKNDLTEYALQGYSKKKNPFLYSSAAWYAHTLGEYFYTSGKTLPYEVRMSRGATIHANGMKFRYIGTSDCIIHIFERIE